MSEQRGLVYPIEAILRQCEKTICEAAQQSVHPTGGIHPLKEMILWPSIFRDNQHYLVPPTSRCNVNLWAYAMRLDTTIERSKMCEFCTEHGEGKKWYLQMKNYADELLHEELSSAQKGIVGVKTRFSVDQPLLGELL